jgi:PiT family inorganic phosphate transporter
VSGSDLILVIVIITGVAFDFTNGFHDTANAVATSIATGALKPRVAVGMSSGTWSRGISRCPPARATR